MSFFSELKRRNVFRVGFAYLITTWLVAQIADLVLASNGDIDGASAVNEQWNKSNEADDISLLLVAAMLGDRNKSNKLAARIDARLVGPFALSHAVFQCVCGTPFDIESTPNFKARIEEAGIPWPPPTRIHYPA